MGVFPTTDTRVSTGPAHSPTHKETPHTCRNEENPQAIGRFFRASHRNVWIFSLYVTRYRKRCPAISLAIREALCHFDESLRDGEPRCRSYTVINTERQDWRRGVEAAWQYRQREGHLDVPYEHVDADGLFPLGRWLSDQRRTFRAGAMTGERSAELEGLGVVWDTAAAGFATNLGAARAYYQLHRTLAAPRSATILDIAIGQYLTNIRRPGGLGKDPERAQRRAAALAAIDPDWNPGTLGWTVDWQRHYAYLAQLLAEGARLTAIVPGVTRHGEDIGRWLATQRRDWDRLNEEQQLRLGELGVKKTPRARKAAAKTATASGPRAGSEAFQKGLQALQQYIAREGGMPGRAVVERLPDGTEHRTGIWLANQKQRRHRLHPAQLAALARGGIDWART
ncbi:helicase associated domain-containing protein [Streptomyces sp. NBC_01214]|nr:helicase associated domain-containing protein [Streptomyces sp. NBC_01214]